MKIPTPHELGFPDKFDRWRPGQLDLVEKWLRSPKRIKAADSPTGSGKSGMAMLYAKMTGLNTLFVTESRGLQDQLRDEFGPMGLVDLRGRRNYTCDMRDGATCEDGHSGKCPNRGTHLCPYSQAEMRAATSTLVVTNYDKWTSSKKTGQGLQHIQQVIFDEAHSAVDAVARAMQVVLHHKEIEETLAIDWPEDTTDMRVWKDWARDNRPIAIALWERARQKVQDASDPKPAWVRDMNHKRLLMRRLTTLSVCQPGHWVCDTYTNTKGESAGYQFDPIRPGRYTEATLLCGVQSAVFMSATIRPKTMAQLHLSADHYDFYEVPSDFPAANCPIYWIPTMRVDAKARDYSPMYVRIDQIVGRRKDRKGIIQPVSFQRRDEIVAFSQFANRMLTNRRGENTGDIVELFKASSPGTLLVSPSVTTGYDFPYDQCEYQILCKVPFPDSRSKIVKARQEDDKEYGPYLAMTKLVQTCGRGMRAADDRCEVFILDDHIEWFRNRYSHLAPKWFRAFFRKITTLPQPPEKL